MKKSFLYVLAFLLLMACSPKENYIDTGVSVGKHDCSIYQYMQTNSFDWDSTILMIQQADLVELFDGSEEITFFGLTNLSIMRYMYANRYERVKDMTPMFCKNMLERHVVRGKYMTTDIAFQIPSMSGKIEGGTTLTSMDGKWTYLAYKQQDDWGNVAQAGPIHLKLRSVTSGVDIPMASSDIDCTNGVVHSLNYDYEIR